jgi:hypothetical protein
MNKQTRKPWFYMGFVVLPADLNGSGIRWTCNCGTGQTLKADTKAGMRGLIRSARKEGVK